MFAIIHNIPGKMSAIIHNIPQKIPDSIRDIPPKENLILFVIFLQKISANIRDIHLKNIYFFIQS